ncbi:hypothetical protein Pint_00339 [Pistacia integerrima]|uniref:Uncharacterized protein n=1 Tax=Pistacia integerrima TaxID=434235 RepID=A0ACC0ZHW0_9ROSI|nr:hypothetical protein Pint_00339 [Pistacia integerrima]
MNDDDTQSPPPLTELILSLEQATIMAKQLHTTTHPSSLLHIHSFLHQANQRLSSFLSSNTRLPPPPTAENSLSSATGAAALADENSGEPMLLADDDEEEISKTSVDKVEERMRDCFIKNKRTKRPLSPSSVAVAEEKRLYEDGFVGGVNGFDPYGAKLRALDLVYQFHS